MFFPGFERLRSSRLDRDGLVARLDAFLGHLPEGARQTINPRIVAEGLGSPLVDVVNLLEAAVDDGILRRRYHIWCPVEQTGIQWLENLADAPELVPCDQCNEGEHAITPDMIAVRYAIAEVPVAVGDR